MPPTEADEDDYLSSLAVGEEVIETARSALCGAVGKTYMSETPGHGLCVMWENGMGTSVTHGTRRVSDVPLTQLSDLRRHRATVIEATRVGNETLTEIKTSLFTRVETYVGKTSEIGDVVDNIKRANERRICKVCGRQGYKTLSDGSWVCLRHSYGPVRPPIRGSTPSRNGLCPCGSLKKYKKCCMVPQK